MDEHSLSFRLLAILFPIFGIVAAGYFYARKHKPITMREPVFVDSAPSHTKGSEVMLMVSPEFLSADDRVLIVDDFLATGLTIDALCRIVAAAGATLVGIAAVVEKVFEGGRANLAHWNVPIVALATITDMSEGRIELATMTADG